MNRAKARDFFSDYYEGALDASLRQVLERSLAEDAELKREYDEFCEVMQDLNAMQLEEIPEPAFLHERIEGRIHAQLEAQKAKQSGWGFRWALPWVGAGIAAVAIVGAFLAINARPTSGPSIGSVIPGTQQPVAPKTASPGVEVSAGEVRLVWPSGAASSVTVREVATGEVMDTLRVPAQGLNSPLKNPADKAVLLEIEGGRRSLFVALPGVVRVPAGKGTGTLMDLAKSLADTFGEAVQVESKTPDAKLNWDFAGAKDALDAARSVATGNVSLEQRSVGLLFLTD